MKRIIITILFFIYIYPVYSYELYVETDKNQVSLGENLELEFKFKYNDSEKIDFSEIEKNISNIKWIENFDIFWPSQEYKNFSQSIFIDWKLQEIAELSVELKYDLKPKKVWVFSIWPFDFKNWEKIISKDPIKINVSEEKKDDFLINDKKNNYIQKIEKEDDFDWKYLFLIIFLILLTWILSYLFYNKKFKNKQLLLEENNLEKNNFLEEKNIKMQNDIVKQTMEEIEENLKMKISNKYDINIWNKTISEMIEEIEFPEEKNKLKEINLLIDKIKYWNFLE